METQNLPPKTDEKADNDVIEVVEENKNNNNNENEIEEDTPPTPPASTGDEAIGNT